MNHPSVSHYRTALILCNLATIIVILMILGVARHDRALLKDELHAVTLQRDFVQHRLDALNTHSR